jgi:hypothetical protein
VVYYSHYGNTAYVADKFLNALSKKGETDIAQLEYGVSRQSLLKRFFFRLFPSLVDLAPLPFDLKDYEVLCLGIPVWGGRPSAPVAKYLHLCKDLSKKKIICFYIYGIKTSATRCSRYLRKILEKKGHPLIFDVFIAWMDVHNQEFLENIINDAIGRIE